MLRDFAADAFRGTSHSRYLALQAKQAPEQHPLGLEIWRAHSGTGASSRVRRSDLIRQPTDSRA